MMTHLTNPLATPEQLHSALTRSSIPSDIHESLFISTQCLTQAAGLLLGLPQSVTAQANVLVARFWLHEPVMQHELSDVSAAALYAASKPGPSPQSPRDVANVYAYLLSTASHLFSHKSQEGMDDPSAYYQTEADYFAFKTRMFTLEARILDTLGFDTHVALPHALAITYLQTMDFLNQDKTEISRRTIQYLNTALLSPQQLYLTHHPYALATAAIYNAAKDLETKTPESEWWEIFDVDREELGFLVVAMRSVEGIMAKRREELPLLWAAMVTREAVNMELKSRGVADGGTAADAPPVDDEEQVMQMMDER